MLGSNQRPLPCEGSVIDCRRSLGIAKCPQIAIFYREHFALVFRRFTQVAARLLHGQCETSEGHVEVSTKFPDAGVVRGIAFRVALVPHGHVLCPSVASLRSLDLESTSVFANLR